MDASIIAASAASFQYSTRTVFEPIDVIVAPGARIAITGPNGSGKTTLLRLLAGELAPAAGKIRRRTGCRILRVPQRVRADDRKTVSDVVAEITGIAQLESRMDRLEAGLASGDTSAIEVHSEAVERWVSAGGDRFEAELPDALDSVGIPPGWAGRQYGMLSGGEAARVRLASVALMRPDCALLDEPDNHLDFEGLQIAGRLITGSCRSAVIASHRRDLLESVATEVVEIRRGGVHRFHGGFREFEAERTRSAKAEARAWEKAAHEKDRLIRLERRVRERAEAGRSRAARSDEPDKFIRRMGIESAERNTAGSGLSKRVARTDVPDKPWRETLSRLLLDSAQPVHAPTTVEVRGASIRRGGSVLDLPPLSIAPGERIRLSGPNGSGKSTLIGVIAGRTKPSGGTVARPRNTRFFEIAQERNRFTGRGDTLVEAFRRVSGLGETEARTALGTMKLGAAAVRLHPEQLSPGQATRAELALLSKFSAACLLLDEPGNHLDLEAMEVLSEALLGWRGALVIASHDPWLIENIGVDRVVDLGESQARRSSTSSTTESASSRS